MASTYLEPASFGRLTSPLKVGFSMPDIGNGDTEEKKLCYQLFCEDGSPVMKAPKVYCPKKAGELPPIDFRREIEQMLYTECPSFAQGTAFMASEEMKKGFYVEYWEKTITINPEADQCVEIEEGSKEKTATFKVINSATQYWEDGSAPFQFFLTSRPHCIPICKSARDFVYACNGGNILIIPQFSDGSSQIIQAPLSGEIGYVGVGPYNIWGDNVPSNVTGYIVRIGGVEYCYVFKCCCKTQMPVYFQEAQGGWSVISFCEMTAKDFESNHSTICRPQPCETPDHIESRRRGGNTIVTGPARKYYTLSFDLPYCDLEWQRWAEIFLASGDYKIIEKDWNGNDIEVKFIVQPGRVNIFTKDNKSQLVVTGYVEQNFNRPNNYN